MNSVIFLKKNQFSQLKLEEKLVIKKLGPPQAEIKASKKDKRKFSTEFYNRYPWLAGCELNGKVYCFPCLLFGLDKTKRAWIDGITDWGHLTEKCKRHESTDVHIFNVTRLALLGQTDVRHSLCEAEQRKDSLHNKEVERNRYVLGRIISCIKFCGAFELALRGKDESTDSENPGDFLGLINFTTELDSIIKSHLETATVFRGTSSTIQNELLSIMLDVCRDMIRREINQSNFLAIVPNDTTDVSTQSQNVVFRYALNGIVQERFWTFTALDDGSAKSIAATVIGCCNDVYLSFIN